MFTPEQFPRLLAASRSAERITNAIVTLSSGVEFGGIRKVELDDAKFLLNDAVNRMWEAHVSNVFAWSGKYQSLTSAEQDLINNVRVWALYEVISASKKLSKSPLTGAMVEAMRSVVEELLPLAMAVVSLKDKVIKGRAPNTSPAKPVNPNKLVQTCPCCFRAIAVVQGTMAHHGYRRPQSGWQTASCPGVRFPQLEVSSSGLEWLIGVLRKQLEEKRAAYAARDEKDILVVVRDHKKVEYTKASPEWKDQFESYVWNLGRKIKMTESELVLLDERLSNWTPAV